MVTRWSSRAGPVGAMQETIGDATPGASGGWAPGLSGLPRSAAPLPRREHVSATTATDEPSRYARLVDRYIDVTSWPTARKTAFLTGLILPVQAVVPAVIYLALTSVPGLVRRDLLGRFYLAWFLGTALLWLASRLATRRSGEGRWTVYALIVVYGGFIVGHLHLFGTLSTPFVIFYAASVYMVLLFFDVLAGIVAFVFGTTLIAASAGLALGGATPYAPLLVARSLDAQLDPAWLWSMLAAVAVIGAFNFFPIQLAVTARVTQERRLRAAHDALARIQERLEHANALIGRYVPTQLATKILDGSYDATRRPERRKLTLFFSDITGFTAAADQMEPEDLAQLLNQYLAEMAAIADRFGATVNQFVGDGIMAFFGAPDATNDRDHALRCVRMALAMQARMGELRARWFEEGIQTPFAIRIGINTGLASVGDFGSEGRITYSAIGNQTNLTARVQAACEPGRVLVTHTTWALVKDAISCKEKGELSVKGLHYPVRVYEVEVGTPEIS
jgi:adenylate cyclase